MTAREIIEAALRSLGVISEGNSMPVEVSNPAFETLKVLLSAWVNEGITIPAITEDTITLIAGTAAYTIGPTGGTVSTRPEIVEAAFVRDSSSNDWPVNVIGFREYAAIPNKTLTGRPDRLYYEPTYPNGTVRVCWTPDAAEALHIFGPKPLAEPAGIASSVVIPAPYNMAIKWNLALQMWPEFPNPGVLEFIAAQAQESKYRVVSMNVARRTEEVDVEVLRAASRGNILTGW